MTKLQVLLLASLLLLSTNTILFIPITVVSASQAAGTETLIGIVGKDFVLLGADSSKSQSIALQSSNIDKIAILTDPFPNNENNNDIPNNNNNKQRHASQQQTILAAIAGDAADADRFVTMLQAEATILEYDASVGCDVEYHYNNKDSSNNDIIIAPAGITVHSMASLARNYIASKLRSPTPMNLCMLIAGMEPIDVTTNTKLNDAVLLSEQIQQQVEYASIKSKTNNDEKIKLTSTMSDNDKQSNDGLVPRLYWLDEYGSIQSIRYGAHGHGSNFCLSILDQGYKPNMSKEQAIALLQDCFEQLRKRYIINSPEPPCIKCVDGQVGCQIIIPKKQQQQQHDQK